MLRGLTAIRIEQVFQPPPAHQGLHAAASTGKGDALRIGTIAQRKGALLPCTHPKSARITRTLIRKPL